MGSRFEKIACTAMSPAAAQVELHQLEQVLLRRFPESVQMLAVCRLASQQRFPKKSLIQFHRYVDGENEDNWPNVQDPFIVCIQEPNLHTPKGVILLVPTKITEDMKKTFDSFIGWDRPQVFQCINERFSPVLQELCTARRNRNPKDSEGIPGIALAITDLEKAKELEVTHESNIHIRSLEERDVTEVVGNWKWAAGHSGQAIKDGLETLPSCGAFTEGGEIVSYVLMSPLGFLNILHTPEKFRRKGYGHLVIQSLSKQIARDLGIHPLSEVEEWNMASKSLLEKSGYQEVYRTRWVYYNPPISSDSTTNAIKT